MRSITVVVGTPVVYTSVGSDSSDGTTLPRPLSVVAIPGAGTLLVETQTVKDGSWDSWPPGAVAVKTKDTLNGPVFALRFTAAAANGVIELNHDNTQSSGGPLWASSSSAGSSSTPAVVGTNCAIITASFTRPANINAYTQYDAVINSTSAPVGLVFSNAARLGVGTGYITKLVLATNQATCTAQFRFHFFTQAVALINDNAQYAADWANDPYHIGYIDVPVLATEGNGSTVARAIWTGVPLQYVLGSTGVNLYCPAPITRGAAGWTPASAQQFAIRLGVEYN